MPDDQTNDFQRYYNALARINFTSWQFIHSDADEKQKQQRLAQMIQLLEKCAEDLSPDFAFLGKPECPAGTTWDPITKTCV